MLFRADQLKGSLLASGLNYLACLAAGQSVPVPEQQEPKTTTSDAEKAEKRKAKKARQRAARAEPAAQTPPAKV